MIQQCIILRPPELHIPFLSDIKCNKYEKKKKEYLLSLDTKHLLVLKGVIIYVRFLRLYMGRECYCYYSKLLIIKFFIRKTFPFQYYRSLLVLYDGVLNKEKLCYKKSRGRARW